MCYRTGKLSACTSKCSVCIFVTSGMIGYERIWHILGFELEKIRLLAAVHVSVDMVGIVSICGFFFSLNYLRKQASRSKVAWAKTN